jgi:hypothetical protein
MRSLNAEGRGVNTGRKSSFFTFFLFHLRSMHYISVLSSIPAIYWISLTPNRCFDTCTPSSSRTAPACTITDATPAPLVNASVPELQREQIDECVSKPFLCAPADW